MPAADPGRPDRRQDILLSAERLFAEHGYAAVSVRDIATEAGVPLALVGYYFGRKNELFATLFEHRRAYVQARLERIAAVDLESAGDPVEAIVRAWAEPALRLRWTEGGEAFSVLVARAVWDSGEESRQVIEKHYDALAEAFIVAMGRALPACDRARLVWGYQYALGALLTHIADRRVERLSGGTERAGDLSRADWLIGFITAGFRRLQDT